MSVLTRSRLSGRISTRESFFFRRLVLRVQVIEEQADSNDTWIVRPPPGHPEPEAFIARQQERAAKAWSVTRRYWRDATQADLDTLADILEEEERSTP